MPKKLCNQSGCRELTDTGRCDAHALVRTPKRVYEHHYHNGKHIYSSGRWKRLRDNFLRSNPLCCMCEQFDIVAAAEVADHIIEIKDGGDIWDSNNLQGLCTYHHGVKTAAERVKRKQKNKFPSISDF